MHHGDPVWAQHRDGDLLSTPTRATDTALARRAVRLAVAGWASPQQVRQVIADLLDAGASCTVRDVIAGLEALAGERRPLPGDDAVDAARRRLARLGGRVLLAGQQGYPAQLDSAWPELGAPAWLFARCDAEALPGGRAVAVVGTREPSLDGLRTATELGRLLGRRGVTVVSGLARGIDQAAHRGALDAGGRTVAVLGTGLGVDYPTRSERLRNEIVASGGLVTELGPGVPPRPGHFLARNRILSGLADVTVVVEGRARSGALQTARLAAAQGREVLAVPGSLNAPTSAGPLALIRDGARPVTCLDDVLEAVDELPEPLTAAGATGARTHAGLDGDAAAVLGLLGVTPSVVADLVHATGRPVGRVLAAVADLSERGLAVCGPRGVVRAG